MRIVITGSAGSLARDVILGLVEAGYDVHGLDLVPPEQSIIEDGQWATDANGRYSYAQLDLATAPQDQIRDAFDGAEAIIHLAGIPLEDTWENLSSANVDATYRVLNTAVTGGVGRVVLASSMHATGLTPIPADDQLLEASIPANPNTLYGASKAAVEGLGKYFAHRYDLEVVALRICSRQAHPTTIRHLSTWLSPADATRLCDAAVRGALPENYWTVWGVSDNTRSWFDMSSAEAIGFRPEDDAERFAGELESNEDDRSMRYTTIGGEFSTDHPPHMKDRK